MLSISKRRGSLATWPASDRRQASSTAQQAGEQRSVIRSVLSLSILAWLGFSTSVGGRVGCEVPQSHAQLAHRFVCCILVELALGHKVSERGCPRAGMLCVFWAVPLPANCLCLAALGHCDPWGAAAWMPPPLAASPPACRWRRGRGRQFFCSLQPALTPRTLWPFCCSAAAGKGPIGRVQPQRRAAPRRDLVPPPAPWQAAPGLGSQIPAAQASTSGAGHNGRHLHCVRRAAAVRGVRCLRAQGCLLQVRGPPAVGPQRPALRVLPGGCCCRTVRRGAHLQGSLCQEARPRSPAARAARPTRAERRTGRGRGYPRPASGRPPPTSLLPCYACAPRPAAPISCRCRCCCFACRCPRTLCLSPASWGSTQKPYRPTSLPRCR